MDNIETATSSDRATVAQLKNKIVKLTSDLKVAQDKFIPTLESNVLLMKQITKRKKLSATPSTQTQTHMVPLPKAQY